MNDIRLLSLIVSDFNIAEVKMDFLNNIPDDFYSEDLTSEHRDVMLEAIFKKMLGSRISLARPFHGDPVRNAIIYRPLISAYAKLHGVSKDFQFSPLNTAYFYFILSRHLSNRIVNETCEYFIYSPRDFYHEIDRIESVLTEILDLWKKAKEEYLTARIHHIMKKRALETVYIPVGVVLLWVYAELKEIDALAHNHIAPRIEDLYHRFPFDPDRNELKKNAADLNERLIRRFFTYFEYTKERAIHLLLSTQEKKNNTTTHTRLLLENADFNSRLDAQIIRLQDLLFLREYCAYTNLVTYESLSDVKFISRIEYEQRAEIHSRLSKQDSQIEKLILIDTARQRMEVSFAPLQLELLHDKSAAGQFLKYLLQQKEQAEAESPTVIKKETKSLSSFGFNGSKTKLKQVIDDLCDQFSLLDEICTPRSFLLDVLTTEDVSDRKKLINMGCETKQFNYIILKLAPFFEKPLLVSIGNSRLFISKNKKQITTSNLRNTKNPSDVKEKQIIDRIFKHLQ